MTALKPARTASRSRRRRDTRRPLSVVISGAVVTAVLLGVILIALESPDGLPLQSHRTLYIAVADPGNLLPHSEVRVRGLLVGQVLSVQTVENRARVQVQLNGSAPQLPTDTKVHIRAQGLLGQRYVELLPGRNRKLIGDGGTLTAPADALTYGVPDALNTFDRQTRGRLGDTLNAFGVGLLGRGRGLNTAIGVGPSTARNFTIAVDAILAHPGAAAQLVPSLNSSAAAFASARNDIVGALQPGVDALAPVVSHRADLAGTLQQAPPTLTVARRGLDAGTRLLGAASYLASSAARALPAAPKGLIDLTTLLRTSRIPLARTARLLNAATPAVPAVLKLTDALSPVLTPVRTAVTSLDPLAINLGEHGCDVYNMASNWRSALGYGVANGSGPELPSGPIGAFNFFRVEIIAGTASLHGLAQPNLSPGVKDVYPQACQYAPGPKYFDPTQPTLNGSG